MEREDKVAIVVGGGAGETAARIFARLGGQRLGFPGGNIGAGTQRRESEAKVARGRN